MPTLIASQVLPLVAAGRVGLFSGLLAPSTTTVAPVASTFNATTAQTITLTDTIGGSGFGTPNGGTVNFTVDSLGTVINVPVVNGIAQATFTIPAGTPPSTSTITSVYSGNLGFSGSSGTSTLTINVPIMPANCDSPAADALLGTAQSFAVLGGSTVTNTGTTNIVGDVGVTPGTAIVGFPPGIVAPGKPGSTGTLHASDALAISAHNAVITAFNTLAGLPSTANLTGQDLGGLTLAPGVYTFSSAAQLTGTLTLNAAGDPNARFVFQIGSTLTTASSSVVNVINGGSPDNVFWQVGSSATLGTTTVFEGNILALTSITLNTRASIACGRALAINGAVTLDTNFLDPVVPPTPPAATPVSQVVPQNNALANQDALYIQALYEQLLGRKATNQEVASWEGILNSPAGRRGVVEGIEQSREAQDYLVNSWYEQYLGRPATNAEESGLVNLLMQGHSQADVLSRVLASDAFAQRSGKTDQQFVQSLYTDLLDQTASGADVQSWVNVLSDVGRQGVAEDLLTSNAFRAASVVRFYQDLLGSRPDGGFNSWMSSHLDLAQIGVGFLESNTFWNKATK